MTPNTNLACPTRRRSDASLVADHRRDERPSCQTLHTITVQDTPTANRPRIANARLRTVKHFNVSNADATKTATIVAPPRFLKWIISANKQCFSLGTAAELSNEIKSRPNLSVECVTGKIIRSESLVP